MEKFNLQVFLFWNCDSKSTTSIFVNQLLYRGKWCRYNNCLFVDMTQFVRVFWSLQNHRVKLISTFHGESLKCWMVSKFCMGEIEIWGLSLALQISANQQALQTVSGTVKRKKSYAERVITMAIKLLFGLWCNEILCPGACEVNRDCNAYLCIVSCTAEKATLCRNSCVYVYRWTQF